MIRSLLLIVIAIVCLFASGTMHGPILELRKEQGFSVADPIENATPLVAFTTVALGGFRGILADMLWIRASQLQEEGKYFELVQLADWITKLEPRFPAVWAFHAWNLAYNVSVTFRDPADRWRWVMNGVGLLRDEGLKFNSGNAALYHELGWLFYHKIGGAYDRAHLYYKEEWARLMQDVLGEAPSYLDGANRQALEDRYRLDLDLMREVDQQYGPVDWTRPQSHALYWAYKGRPFAKGFDAISIDRLICQSLLSLFRQGRTFEVPGTSISKNVADFELLPNVQRAFEEAYRAHPNVQTFATARETFVKQAVVVALTQNRKDVAERLLDQLKGDAMADGRETLEHFAYVTLTSQLPEPKNVAFAQLLSTLIDDSVEWRLVGEKDFAEGVESIARICMNEYIEANPAAAFRLPSMEKLLQEAEDRAMKRLGMPQL